MPFLFSRDPTCRISTAIVQPIAIVFEMGSSPKVSPFLIKMLGSSIASHPSDPKRRVNAESTVVNRENPPLLNQFDREFEQIESDR
ncbi:hypothetical protein [Phormidesmis priestleyi]|uniref:hypothetical protein n=1 Tax=Phormidesmis priestleyi TaxID=268141 RepID=UPI00116054F9|nr:hypothetical protein [Phormidesmis priestleyi]